VTITVATSRLIDLLTDGLRTASSITGGIHLATHRAPYRDEPGDVDLLSATSNNHKVLGHGWIPVDGHIVPHVWPLPSTRNALALLKNLAKKGDNHQVDIRIEKAPPPENLKEGEHPGWTVTISEAAALFDADTEFQFHALDELKFPSMRSVARMLGGLVKAPEEEDLTETPLTVWSAGVLGAIVKVAASNGGTIRLYRNSNSRLQVVSIGDTWLGAAYPDRALPGEPHDAPGVDPVLGVEPGELNDDGTVA